MLNVQAFKNITTNTTTVVKGSGPGVLHSLVVNQPGTSETITIYDSPTASGTKIATIVPSGPITLLFDVEYVNGLTVVTAGTAAGDYTVTYQ